MTVAGFFAYRNLGRLEFPPISVKTAVVITLYPGASPEEVEEEVTDLIETTVQQLSQLDKVRSISKEGMSIVFVDIKMTFDNDELPQIWDELRKKVGDVHGKLPSGAYPPQVNDGWGDEFGVFFAVTGSGYSYKELKDYVDFLRKELLLVEDVAKVEIQGEQQEVVYIEMSRARMSSMGISPRVIFNTLNQQNMVKDAGKVEVGEDVGGDED